MRCGGSTDRIGKKKEKGENKVKMGIWGEEKLREFREKIENEKIGGWEEKGVDTLLEKLKIAIDKVREEVKPREKEEGLRRGWWDDESRESKERKKESIRKWRKGEMEKEELDRNKRDHARKIEERKQKEKEIYMKEVDKTVKEEREWEVINTERGGRKVLRRRLERQVEEKGSIPHNQTGFRKSMETIDNVYVLNHLVNRNLRRKKADSNFPGRGEKEDEEDVEEEDDKEKDIYENFKLTLDRPGTVFKKIAMGLVGRLPITTSGNKYILNIQALKTLHELHYMRYPVNEKEIEPNPNTNNSPTDNITSQVQAHPYPSSQLAELTEFHTQQNRDRKKKKIEEGGKEGIFLGHSVEPKGYRVWIPKECKIESTRDMKFFKSSLGPFKNSYEDFLSENSEWKDNVNLPHTVNIDTKSPENHHNGVPLINKDEDDGKNEGEEIKTDGEEDAAENEGGENDGAAKEERRGPGRHGRS
ncbi:myb-like protein X [Belonocnema kinseyi]|uniref:myb-like protein X n=1 Tax=Belonocnema kinseyi TaxID=2817044 RepID=UPI00143D6B69|nr:myb-like protein X [Belonocnema kinseyi]